MPRKVILDVDPGIDDAVAIAMALFDPRLEVVAITAVEGNVNAEQSTRNVQAIVEQLDPPRWPRIGAASPAEHGAAVDSRHLFGANGLGDAQFKVAELHHQHASEKVLAEEIRKAPDAVTVVALGPLTNLANALRRDATLAGQIGHLIIMGGAVGVPGNVTPAAEFNAFFDPRAARDVFRSRTTKTLVPLDVTGQVLMSYDFLQQAPAESTRAGSLLRQILPFAFRSHRNFLGLEGIHVHDAVALLAATNPELFATQRLGGDVETSGELTMGATVFDRRQRAEWRYNMEVALEIDAVGAADAILRGLAQAGRAG